MARKLTKFNGVEVDLGGTTYVMPPLPVKAFSKGDASAKIQHIQDELMKAQSENKAAIPQECVDDLVSLVAMALRRNYPDMDEATVEDGLADITSLFSLFQPLITQDGNMVKRMEEEQRKNETRAFVEGKAKA